MKIFAIVFVCFGVGVIVLYALDCVIGGFCSTTSSREFYQDDPQIADKVGDDE